MIDDKERNAADPQLVGLLDFCHYTGLDFRIHQSRPKGRGIHSVRFSYFEQDLDIADILPVFEIGGVNILDNGINFPFGRERDETMRERGVRRLRNVLKVEGEPDALSHPARAFEELLEWDPPAALAVHLRPKIQSFRRDAGIEIERLVLDGDRLPAPILQRSLQMPLSDAAERSDRVVIDRDMHAHCLRRDMRASRLSLRMNW